MYPYPTSGGSRNRECAPGQQSFFSQVKSQEDKEDNEGISTRILRRLLKTFFRTTRQSWPFVLSGGGACSCTLACRAPAVCRTIKQRCSQDGEEASEQEGDSKRKRKEGEREGERETEREKERGRERGREEKARERERERENKKHLTRERDRKRDREIASAQGSNDEKTTKQPDI